jgi:hypothetical protein
VTIKRWLLALAVLTAACGGSDANLDQNLKLNEDPNSVLLTVESGGGFVPVEFVVNQGPSLVLERDGTVISQGPQIEIYPGPLLANWQESQLDDETMLFVLEELDAIGFPEIDRVDNTEITGVADAPTTSVTFYNQDGEHVFSVYALGIADQGITDARVPILANLVQELYDATALVTGQSYEPSAIQVVAGEAGEFDANDPTVNFLDWPLADAYADMSETGVEGWRCAAYEGEQAQSLLEVFSGANQATYFTADGVDYRFQVRPLFPGEEPCEPVV